jgi:raffinose/stachyose/melibiose transport system permease protein/xylobiose transport system permease protein
MTLGTVSRHARHSSSSGTPHRVPPRPRRETPAGPLRRRLRRVNVPGGVAAACWLVVVAVPLYYIVVTSLRTSDDYLTEGALRAPGDLTMANYGHVFQLGFATFLFNSLVVTGATVAIVLLLALPASYAIVRGTSRTLRWTFNAFLLGLAIPAQAVIVPIYFIITRLHLYDAPTAIILPTAAFALPISVLVLTSTLRDIPEDLYEAMTIEGAGTAQVFRQLVIPLARPGLVTIGIFSGLSGWNGFLFPLVLTQSPERRVLPLGLWNFQNQYGTDVPGLMAAVVLSAVPVLALYLFGRRYLLRGIAAGFGR